MQSPPPESWLSKPANVLLPMQINTTEQLPMWKVHNFWSAEFSVVITVLFLTHKYGSQRWHQNKTPKCKLASSNSRPLKLIFHSHFRDKSSDIWKRMLPEWIFTKFRLVAATSSSISDFQQRLYQTLILTHTRKYMLRCLQQKQLIVPFKKIPLEREREKSLTSRRWKLYLSCY